MKTLTEYINEAQRIDLRGLKDEDLLLLFWEAWSGYFDPRKTGTSSNARAMKLEQYICDKYEDPKNHMKTYDLITTLTCDLDEQACKNAGVSEFSMKKDDLEKRRTEVKKLIDEHIKELLETGKMK